MKSPVAAIIKATVKGYAALSVSVAVAVSASVLLSLLPPMALERIINEISIGNELPFAVAAALCVTYLLSGVADSLKERLIASFGQKITKSIRKAMSEKLYRLPAEYFVKNDAGNVASRFTNDVDTVELLFSSGIVSLFADACKIIGIVAVVSVKSAGLGLLLLIALPLLYMLTRFFRRRTRSAQLQNRSAVAKISGHIPETVRCIRTIHVFRKEEYMKTRYDGYLGDAYKAVEKSNACNAVYSPVVQIISALIIAVMMSLSALGGSVSALFGMSVGTAVAVIAYVGKVFEPLEAIGNDIQNLQSSAAGVQRINEFLRQPEREIKSADIAQNADAVVFDDVSFGYGDGEVLTHVSFTVKEGESVTLTGRTGIGKSTMLNLIIGLYSPQSGRVNVFGCPSPMIKDECKRRVFGYVGQSFNAVPGTVKQQITLFDGAITEDEVRAAARLAGIDDVIMSFPNGYDTVVTPELFSQGQKQLLAIARAVVCNPKILLLDEITAGLDSATEREVTDAIRGASQNRTVISVSHRLSDTSRTRIINLK